MKPDNAMVQVLTSKLRALEVAYSLAEALQKTLRDAGLCFDGVTSVMEGVSASLGDVQGALRGCDHPVEPNGLSCARCGAAAYLTAKAVPPPGPNRAAQEEANTHTLQEAVGYLWGLASISAIHQCEEGACTSTTALLQLAAKELGKVAAKDRRGDVGPYYVTVKLGDKTFAMVNSTLLDLDAEPRLSRFSREQDAMTAGLVSQEIAIVDVRRLTRGTDL